MTDDVNFVIKARREKLDALRAASIEPFAYSYDRSHTTQEAIAAMPAATEGHEQEGPRVSVAGRIVAWRAHGKTVFAHLADMSGRIQLYFRRDQLGDEKFDVLSHFDLGDIIGVAGPLFRTRTGETTVRVESFELLAKSLRPLPYGKEEVVNGETVRHSGFSDPEQRYRQRYADLAVHPEVRTLFVARSRMITEIRAFLDKLGFLEVETPLLHHLAFLEVPGHQNPGHARAHFDFARAGGLADVLPAHRQRLLLGHHHVDFGRRHAAHPAVATLAAFFLPVGRPACGQDDDNRKQCQLFETHGDVSVRGPGEGREFYRPGHCCMLHL